MNDAVPHDVGKTINTWVQTIAILGAAIWALTTFVFKEILVPKAAPINISLNLQLKKIGTKPTLSSELVAIEMRASATNPSTRTVYLFPTYWMARGYRIVPMDRGEKAIKQDFIQALKSRTEVYRYAGADSYSVLAGGMLFEDNYLKPGETIGRTLIFYAPPQKYDLVDVETYIATAEDMRGIELEWGLGTDLEPEPKVYRVVGDKRELIPPDKDGGYSDTKREFQSSHSRAQLSLWQ